MSFHESQEPVPEPKDVPVLVQLRLLDQRDSTAKVNMVTAGFFGVIPENKDYNYCIFFYSAELCCCSLTRDLRRAHSKSVIILVKCSFSRTLIMTI